MRFSSNSYPLTDATYRLLTELICQSCGLRFDQSAKPILARRLSLRMQELKLDTFEKYYQYLRYHPEREKELEEVFDLITTSETYFFREELQLKAFTDEIIPELLLKNHPLRTIRIWSAGCSTGEEPYTVAILCKRISELQNWGIEILASDISQRVIQRARRGLYAESSFRSTEPSIRQQYFEAAPDGKYRVKDEIRQMVMFGKVNLIDPKRVTVFGEFDVIFCRNVLIYFDLEARKKVVETFYQKLKPEGFLLLGHAESLLSLSTKFRLRHLQHDMVYQKPPAHPSSKRERR